MGQVARQTLDVGVAALTAATGVPVQPAGDGFVALTAANDWFFPVGSSDGTALAVHVETDAAIAGTFTVEVSNMPKDPSAAPNTTDFDNVVGHWLQWNPAAAVVPAAAGSTPTAATVVVVAGAAGGFMFMLPDWGPRRTRIRAHITAPGKCRVLPSAKD